MRPGMLLALVGGLIGVGVVLSFYGSYTVIEDLVRDEARLESGQTLAVEAELDPELNELGVWAVQTSEFEGTVHARLFDPGGSQIGSATLDDESFEESFDIEMAGTYQAVIENDGPDASVMLALGHAPDSSKYAIVLTGGYILLVGMIGIVVVIVYTIARRRRSS